MKDVLGKEIQVGDILFYGETGRYAEFMVCKVVQLTPKTVVAERIKGDRHGSNPYRVRIMTSTHCVIITPLVDLSQ